MKVILLQELKGKGGEGDVVEVTRGHAVNYLFPKKIAVEATKGNLKQLELRKHNIAKRETERLDTADKLFDALNESVIKVYARVGEEGQLFGSITSTQIAEAIQEKFNVEIDRKKIDIRSAIKTEGEHLISLAIYRDVRAVITVNVVDENIVEGAEEVKEAAEPEAADAAEVSESDATEAPEADAAKEAAGEGTAEEAATESGEADSEA